MKRPPVRAMAFIWAVIWSEFLAVGSFAILAVYLRQGGSGTGVSATFCACLPG